MMDINMAVAQNIKRFREEKKLTLDKAAEVTGVSRSMLAQIEKGDVNPTISVLWKIANGYKVSFTSLVENNVESTTILKFKEESAITEEGGKYINYPVFPFEDGRVFETYRIVILPEGHLEAQPHLAGTEEYITVFDGEVEISVNDQRFTLKKGDSIRFKSDVPHGYQNIGQNQVQLSMLIYYGK